MTPLGPEVVLVPQTPSAGRSDALFKATLKEGKLTCRAQEPYELNPLFHPKVLRNGHGRHENILITLQNRQSGI